MTEFIDPSIVYLCDEATLSYDEQENRLALGRDLIEHLPRKVLECLSVWQPAVGCLNRCSFCSQESGTYLRMLNGASVRTLAGAFRYVQHQLDIPYVSCGRLYKPGIIFPYLDNDIGSYPYLIDYLVSAWSLGMRVRTSTIGWNRRNEQLNCMHRTIVRQYSHMLAGVRFSLNAYSAGWHTNRDSFIEDFVHAMLTYRPLLRLNDPQGHSGGCIDLSLSPDVIPCNVNTVAIADKHVTYGGEYCVVSNGEQGEAWLALGGYTPEQVVNLISLHAVPLQDLTLIHGYSRLLQNEDGTYLGFYPDTSIHETDGVFMFPANDKRNGGVFAACWPLRELGDYLRANDAIIITFDDIRQQASMFADAPCHTKRRNSYLRKALLPMIDALCRIFDALDLAPQAIFDNMVVRDRGMIRNSGRAYYEFRALASGPNIMVVPEPVLTSGSAEEVWRIFPAMQIAIPETITAQGGKSMLIGGDMAYANQLCLVSWAVDAPSHTHTRKDGRLREEYYIPISAYVSPMEVYDLHQGRLAGLVPGS